MQSQSGGSSGFFKSILGWVPNWVGFGLLIVAGILMIVFGIIGNPASAGLIAFGIATIISAILAWVVGGRATPEVNPFEKSFGASVDGIDGWAWLVIFALYVIAVLIAIFVH